MDTQLLAWAIDRAIRVAEVNKSPVSVSDITSFAEELVAFIDKHTAVPEVDEDTANSEVSNSEAANEQ